MRLGLRGLPNALGHLANEIGLYLKKTKEEDENVNKKFNCSINYCFSIKNVNTLNVFHF